MLYPYLSSVGPLTAEHARKKGFISPGQPRDINPLLFWLPHGLGLPMVLFQNVVDPPPGRGLRRRVVSLSFVGVAAASLFVPLTF